MEQSPNFKFSFPWLFLILVMGCVAVELTFNVFITPQKPVVKKDSTPAKPNRPNPAPFPRTIAKVGPQDNETVVDDDGQLLWASPTQGEPISLQYLPDGVQLIFYFRPSAIDAHAEGEKIFAALGPWGKRIKDRFRTWFPGNWNDTSNITLAVSPRIDNKLSYLLRIELETEWSEGALQDRLGRFETFSQQQQTYYIAAEKAYWLPADRGEKVLIVCMPGEIKQLIESANLPAALPRDLQRLIPQTDRQRMFTAALAARFLQGSGRELIVGADDKFPKALNWFLGDNATAAMLSLHWQRDFFIELVAISTLNVRPHHYAKQLGMRVSEVHDQVESYLVKLASVPYGGKVLTRMPGMLRILADYTRVGSEQGHAVLRAYLPAKAGHNLIMAAERMLAQPAEASFDDSANKFAPNRNPAQTIRQKASPIFPTEPQ